MSRVGGNDQNLALWSMFGPKERCGGRRGRLAYPPLAPKEDEA